MEDLSEEAIKKNCPHCDTTSQTFLDFIEEIGNFYLVCDAHPLTEGHLMIIPKAHLSCIGVYPPALLEEFINLNNRVCDFVKTTFGSVATFEHGIFGQTVFHSHVHYLPFGGAPDDVVPEGKNNYSTVDQFSDLKNNYQKDGGYLFFSIGDKMWTANAKLAKPRFFRDRFALALGHPERSDWKAYHKNPEMMKMATEINKAVIKAWKEFNK